MKDNQHKVLGKREHVRQHVLDLISRQTAVGSRVKSEDEISKELGVSRSTVHGVLSEFARKGIVSRRPRAGTILRNPNHELLQQKSVDASRVLAFVALFPKDATFGSPMLEGADSSVNHSKFLLIYKQIFYPGDEKTECTEIEKVSRLSDGMILYSSMRPTVLRLLRQLQKRNYPLVHIDHHPTEGASNCVCTDNEGGVTRLMKHLMDLGHRRIAMISGNSKSGWSSQIARESAYVRAMQTAGLPPCLLHKNQDNLDGMIDKLLKSTSTTPTAIVTLHDNIALEVYAVLKARGLRVPKDISLAGFNDDPVAASCDVPLTTIRQDQSSMGARAAELLQDMVCGHLHDNTKIFVPAELVVRQSTAQIK